MNESLLQYLLESCTGLVLFYLFYALVLKRETCFQFNRFYLLAALALSFLVPLSNLPGIALWPQEPVVMMEAPLEEMPLLVSEVVAAPASTFSYWFLLYGAYGLGVLFFAARAAVQVRQLQRFAKAEGTSFYLPNQAPVILTHGQFPTFSFWRWVFFDNSQPLTPEETDRILQHEQVHIDQRHTLDILLVSLVGGLFWFNPLLVLYKKAVEQTHEFIADAQVARRTGPSAYSSLLVKQVFRTADFPLGSYFFLHTSLTLTRIKMMKKLHQSPKLSRMLMALPVAGLLLIAVAAMRPVLPEPVSTAGTVPLQNGSAQFPGGREALNAYVKTNFVLPEVAFQKRKRQQDFVQVKASIEVEVRQDGSAGYLRTVALEVQPKDDAVLKAVEQQFVRLVSQMPQWTPAQKGGKAVASKETISVASVSGNFLSYADYLGTRQQKTSVTSKGKIDHNAVTKRAEYPGGKNAMYHYFLWQFRTPEEVFKLRPHPDSTLNFNRLIKAELLIDEKGRMTQVNFVEVITKPGNTAEVNKAVKKEFLRLAHQMKQWTPAMQDGKPVASKEIVEFGVARPYLTGNDYEKEQQLEVKVAARALTQEPEPAAPTSNNVYIAVEQMPEFPGGMAGMMKYLGENFVIPAEEKAKGTEGTIVSTFVVTKEGNLTQVQVLKGVSPGLDQEAIRVLTNMPAWKPGQQNGKPVAVRFTLPYRIVASKSVK